MQFTSVMDIILNIFYFLFDVKKLRAKSDKGEKIGWLEVIISPSIRYAILIGLILSCLLFIFRPCITGFRNKNLTENRLVQIQKEMIIYKDKTGSLPASLDQLIGGNPIRQNWSVDAWGNEIIYKQTGSSFELISIGKDKTWNSTDDIKVIN